MGNSSGKSPPLFERPKPPDIVRLWFYLFEYKGIWWNEFYKQTPYQVILWLIYLLKEKREQQEREAARREA